jgi:hypothetical protein
MKILCPHCKNPQHIEAPKRGDFYFYDCECGALLQFETSIGGTVFVSVECVPGAGVLTGTFEPVEEAALTVAEMRSLLAIYEAAEEYENCQRIFEMIKETEK